MNLDKSLSFCHASTFIVPLDSTEFLYEWGGVLVSYAVRKKGSILVPLYEPWQRHSQLRVAYDQWTLQGGKI